MSNANDIRKMLEDTAQRVFADKVDAHLLTAAKQSGWSADLWQSLEEIELPRVGLPEELGGAGGTLSDAAAVLRIAARHAAPVPLAETLLAGWLLTSAGIPVPSGVLTVAPVLANDEFSARQTEGSWRISGTLHRVPFARMAKQVVLLKDGQVFIVDAAPCRITPGRNLASEARDTVTLDGAPARASATPVSRDQLMQRGALLRAVQIGGALERALALACEHARQRTQFGRQIAQFQAIQQEVARCGGEVAACVAAGLSAVGIVERGEDRDAALLAVASAKVRAADAAREAVAIAHQVHGAMGVTDEYALHHVTLRALAWREEFGNDVVWAARLGRAMRQVGANAYWPLVSAA
jgi:acyl-CoA dehydrogenase